METYKIPSYKDIWPRAVRSPGRNPISKASLSEKPSSCKETICSKAVTPKERNINIDDTATFTQHSITCVTNVLIRSSQFDSWSVSLRFSS